MSRANTGADPSILTTSSLATPFLRSPLVMAHREAESASLNRATGPS